MKNKIITLIILTTFLLFTAFSITSADPSVTKIKIERLYQAGNEESPIPTDVKPIETKKVAIIPFGTMKPATKESVEIARGVEILTMYYLDFFYKFDVFSTSAVAEILSNIDLPKAPGVNEARELAMLLNADYVVFGNVTLNAPDLVLKGSWYDVKNNSILSYVEQTASISMLLRDLTNFSRQLAYAPTVKFERGDLEKKAEKRPFCKYINTFRFYVQAYLHFLRGELNAAEGALDKAIMLEPDFVRGLIFKADIVLNEQVSGPAAASAHLSKINTLIAQLESLKPESTGDFMLFWKLGTLVFYNGKAETMKAHDLYLKSYLLRSNWLPAYANIILDAMPALMSANKYYRNMDNIFNAAKDLQKIFPDNPNAKFVLGYIYWKLGVHDTAAEVLQEITEKHSNFVNAYRLLVIIKEIKEPHFALVYAQSGLSHHPFDYDLRYRAFLTLFRTAFNAMNFDDDDDYITLEEIKRVIKRDLPEKKIYNIYRSMPLGFKEKYFSKYDLDKDEKLSEVEFVRLLANYGYGPVERTNLQREDGFTSLNLIADELWHHALICYALRGLSGPGIVNADLKLLKAFINADPNNLEKYYEYEKVYTEIVSDETMSAYHNIENPLSNLIIYWGLAKNYKSYKTVAMQLGKKFIEKRDVITQINKNIKKKSWLCTELNLFMHPDRTMEARFAPKDLPDYKFEDESSE